MKTRLPARAVLTQAKVLLESYVHTCLASNKEADAPVLSNAWLRDWCLEYNVSMRKPSRNYQVPKWLLQEHLRVMGCNVFRVR